MKLLMDERVKHRLVGLAVIISIGAIVAPALMKKSSQGFDRNISVAVQLPPKPALPKIEVPNKTALFEKVKVAQVTIPKLNPNLKPETTLAKASILKPYVEPAMRTEIAQIPTLFAQKVAIAKKVMPVVAAPKIMAKKGIQQVAKAPKTTYSVQLAYFAKQNNAVSLVNRLKTKGYKASYTKVVNKKEVFYKVLVGSLNEKNQAILLKQKLASALKMNGMVVPTTRIS